MEKKTDYKQPRVSIRYTDEDFTQLKKAFARSSCSTIAGFVRKLSLSEPVEIITRNASFDAFVEGIVALRKEMAAIRQSGSLSPERQDELVRLHASIQDSINKIAEVCMP